MTKIVHILASACHYSHTCIRRGNCKISYNIVCAVVMHGCVGCYGVQGQRVFYNARAAVTQSTKYEVQSYEVVQCRNVIMLKAC
jgi:hypothetical protein